MKKHIFGLAIFSLIVGTAALVYAVFIVPATVQVAEVIPVSVALQDNSSGRPTSCWNMNHKRQEANADQPIITQAVYNVKTKKLVWKLSFLANDSTVIYFFAADEKGVHRIDAFVAAKLSGSKQISSYTVDGEMLSNLSSKTNLYLMTKTKPIYVTDEIHAPIEFDSDKAFPVSIDYGK